MIETQAPQSLSVTEAAAAKVRELIEGEGNEALKLRVFVTGGGCSGFSYGFTFDEAQGKTTPPWNGTASRCSLTP